MKKKKKKKKKKEIIIFEAQKITKKREDHIPYTILKNRQ
jgi:hypothetical protein